MIGQSWTHRLARPLVRPLVGTGITPNHITTARLVTGLMASCALMPGTAHWTFWAGWLWLLSAFLDRADGELARVGNMASAAGKAWDFKVDLAVNPSFFLAMGISLRQSVLGDGAIVLGVISCVAVFLAAYWASALEHREARGVKAYPGIFGFDFDDMLYLFAPLAWLHWLPPLLVASAVGGPVVAALTAWRLSRLHAAPSGDGRTGGTIS